jgi:hypothetical protein
VQLEKERDPRTSERLEKQDEFLTKVYQAELAQDPTSHATESSRSNLIALRHTVSQIYGGPSGRDALLGFIDCGQT